MLKVLITGGTGFIGQHLVNDLLSTENYSVVVATRKPQNSQEVGVEYRYIEDIGPDTNWESVLSDIDIVIHAAARAHVLREEADNPIDKFRTTNVQGTKALAHACLKADVDRFIYLSSIGVNGNSTTTYPFSAYDFPDPQEPYAQSKLEAEQILKESLGDSEIKLVVVRPPLVYGPEAPGNFGLLAKVMQYGIPLPLAGINNARSFVSVWNLSDLIRTCIEAPKADDATVLVRDGEDISTSELLQKMALAQGRNPRLFWVPSTLLKVAATLLGKRQIYDRLFDSLQVDDTVTREILGWEPPLSLDGGIKRSLSTE